jgi:hypothetical protein
VGDDGRSRRLRLYLPEALVLAVLTAEHTGVRSKTATARA